MLNIQNSIQGSYDPLTDLTSKFIAMEGKPFRTKLSLPKDDNELNRNVHLMAGWSKHVFSKHRNYSEIKFTPTTYAIAFEPMSRDRYDYLSMALKAIYLHCEKRYDGKTHAILGYREIANHNVIPVMVATDSFYNKASEILYHLGHDDEMRKQFYQEADEHLELLRNTQDFHMKFAGWKRDRLNPTCFIYPGHEDERQKGRGR